MAASPLDKQEIDHNQSGDDEADMSRAAEEAQAAGLADFEVKEQDRWLPIANVARIMKTALPDNAKIAKEAKECMQECVSEFISFITSEASEKCQQEKRKTVNGEDILFAMTSLGFENYAEALKIYLSKYRETQTNRAESAARPTSSSGFPAGGPAGGNQNGQESAFDQGQPSDSLTQDPSGPYYSTGVTSGHNGMGGDVY